MQSTQLNYPFTLHFLETTNYSLTVIEVEVEYSYLLYFGDICTLELTVENSRYLSWDFKSTFLQKIGGRVTLFQNGV